jgi:uncharacterized protein
MIMKQAKIILIPIVLAYLTIVGVYFTLQRKMIFQPVALDGTTPKKYSQSYRDVTFPSSDGVTLKGWWIEHPQRDSKRPVLLYCHGNGDCLSQLAEVSKLFYDFGFDALIFDYRSYGGSSKAPLSEKAVENDALAAYQWLKDKGIPDDRVLIWGHSLGSSVAANLATQTRPAGLILEGAFPSIYAVSRQRNPWLLLFPFMILDPFDTEKYVTQRACPLLMIHAERDTIIPIELGQRVFEKAADPKEWLLVKGINHNDFPSVAVKYKGSIQDFARRCLSGRARAKP